MRFHLNNLGGVQRWYLYMYVSLAENTFHWQVPVSRFIVDKGCILYLLFLHVWYTDIKYKNIKIDVDNVLFSGFDIKGKHIRNV